MPTLYIHIARIVPVPLTEEQAQEYNRLNRHVEEAAETDDPNLPAMVEGLDSLLVVLAQGTVGWDDEIVDHTWEEKTLRG